MSVGRICGSMLGGGEIRRCGVGSWSFLITTFVWRHQSSTKASWEIDLLPSGLCMAVLW